MTYSGDQGAQMGQWKRQSTLVPVQRGGLTFYELNPDLQYMTTMGTATAFLPPSTPKKIRVRRSDKPSYRERQARHRARTTKRPPKEAFG